MRAQPTTAQTDKKHIAIFVTGAVLLLAMLAGLLFLRLGGQGYTPPAFDTTQIAGEPEPEQSLAYSDVGVENGFSFSVAGNIYQQADGSVLLYLTNPPDSGCILQGEIRSADGTLLYQSGAIRPGSYVPSLAPQTEFPNEAMEVELRVYAFAPETWYSMGTITLSNTLQAW